MKKLLLMALVLLSTLAWAEDSKPKFIYDVDFVTDFDNREYHDPYDASRTIFGFRLTPTIGVGFSDSIGGRHKFLAGATYIQPCGADWRHVKVMPTVYYQWAVAPFRVSMGFIPYSELYYQLPDYLRSDSLSFMCPNIQGALFQFRNHWGYLQAFADWRGMYSREYREAFRIVADGKFYYRWMYAGLYAQLNHLANSLDKHEGVNDDVLINPLMGLNFTDMTPLDSLSFHVGYMCGIQRHRRLDEVHIAHGMQVDFMLQWRFLGFHNSLYFGGNQMPLYGRFGSLLNQGDPHYQASLYDRMDFYVYLIRRSFVTCYAGWNLLITNQGTLSHQQQIVCRFSLDQALHHREKKVLRSLSYR